MSEEDDWFERALRGTDEGSDEPPVGSEETDDGDGEGPEPNDETAESDGADPDAGVAEDVPDEAEGVPDDPAKAIGIGTGDEANEDPFGGDEEASEDPFGGANEDGTDIFDGDADGGGTADDSSGDDDPFGGGTDAGADAESGAGGESDGTDPFGDDDPFGGSRNSRSGGASDVGGNGQSGGSGDDAGNDPFGGYRGSAAGDDDEFGFDDLDEGDGGPREATDFDVDPDEFESEIERTDVGIEGLDDMILGGVPSRSLLSVIGGAGTGKTTFALQFLNHALESGNKGIYITLEQTRESIYDTADEKGCSFREHADEDRLAVVAIDPIEMANSLSSIRNDLIRLIAEFDADRLVLDSVSLLEMMYDHPAKRRSEVFGFTRSLKEAGVTTLLTSEASEDTPYASRHGIVEYLTDAVFVLQYVRGSDFRETRLAVEIQKIRDANHSRETKPYDITDTGISVYDQANIF